MTDTIVNVQTGEVTTLPSQSPVTVDQIKREAERRILAIMNRDQQNNALAKGLEMTIVYGADPAAWPEDARLRAIDALAKWSRIEAIRAASDVIEEMDPIPSDYRDDKHWGVT